MDRFAQLLFDLGREIGENLYPDPNRICQLNFEGKLHIQLEYDEPEEKFRIATFVCDAPPGKYRELLLKEALRANYQFPRVGTFAYSDRNNKLTLFESLYAPPLTGEKIFKTLESFIKEALMWKEAVERAGPLPTQIKK